MEVFLELPKEMLDAAISILNSIFRRAKGSPKNLIPDM